jgi:hypothetical protein
MNQGKGRVGHKAKDLKGKKLSVTQQAVVRGGVSDGTSNTLMLGEKALLPAVRVRRGNGTASP